MSRTNKLENTEKIYHTDKSIDKFRILEMMKLKEGNMYAAIYPNDSVMIDGKYDTWPPKDAHKLYGWLRRGEARRQYIKMVLRIVSPIRKRIRTRLEGNLLLANGEYKTITVCAWYENLILFHVDYKKKKVYRIKENRHVKLTT